MTLSTFFQRSVLLGSIALLSLSCGKKNEFAPPPPMPVGVQSPIVRDQPTFTEFPGHLEAMQSVQLRARISNQGSNQGVVIRGRIVIRGQSNQGTH